MPRPSVLHVTTTDISQELLLGPQLRAFADAGYAVSAASAPGPYVERLRRRGVPHHPLAHATRSMNVVADAKFVVELGRLAKSLRPDIVHLHNPKPGWFGRPTCKLAGAAVVNTVHGLYATPDDPWPKRAAVYALEAASTRFSDVELLQNPEDLPVLRALGVPQRKLVLLGNGVDLQRFRPPTPAERDAARASLGIERGQIAVGAVGRLVAEKGYPELLAAAASLRATCPQLVLVVAGPSDPEKADAIDATLLAEAERSGVRLLGMRDDIEQVYWALDCYVLASRREGFPRSAMEAAASGLPLVATDIRGCRQVVDHGWNGLLVPPRAPDDLARALAFIATDRQTRERMAQASLRVAHDRFAQEDVIATTLAVYDRLLAERASAGRG